MSPLRLTGSTSGYSQIDAPAVAGDQTFTLPGTGGTIVTTAGTQTLTNKTIQGGAVTSGTAVASTSGTAIDFTGIPSWVKRITVMFNEVSTSGTSNYLVQIGDAGGIEATGYKNNCQVGATATSSTTGFMILNSVIAATTASGSCVLTLLNAASFLWTQQAILSGTNGTNVYQSSGMKALSETLTQVRITTVNGTDTFDAGTINILYEG